MNQVNVKIKYLGLVKNTVGLEEETVSLPDGSRVEDVFNLLREKHGEQFNSVVFRSDGRLRPTARVLLNEEDIRNGDGANSKLEGEQEISLLVGMYPASGGQSVMKFRGKEKYHDTFNAQEAFHK